jgi:hypothetical protein
MRYLAMRDSIKYGIYTAGFILLAIALGTATVLLALSGAYTPLAILTLGPTALAVTGAQNFGKKCAKARNIEVSHSEKESATLNPAVVNASNYGSMQQSLSVATPKHSHVSTPVSSSKTTANSTRFVSTVGKLFTYFCSSSRSAKDNCLQTSQLESRPTAAPTSK